MASKTMLQPTDIDVNTLRPDQRVKQTFTIHRAHGPLVFDVWEPRYPSGKPPVLLVHGWGGSSGYWKPTAKALSETVQVIVPDLPGTGRSMPVSQTQDMYDQTATLAFLLRELDLDRVQIVGHSMGAAMALLLTQLEPERVERLALTSTSFFRTEAQVRVYRSVMQAFRLSMEFRPSWLSNMPGMANLMAQRYFHKIPDDTDLLVEGLRDYLALDSATARACADNAPDDAIPEAGAACESPVLLIACRQDMVMPLENVEHTASIIPDCDVVWMEECGHIPMVEKTDEYLDILRGFLKLEA